MFVHSKLAVYTVMEIHVIAKESSKYIYHERNDKVMRKFLAMSVLVLIFLSCTLFAKADNKAEVYEHNLSGSWKQIAVNGVSSNTERSSFTMSNLLPIRIVKVFC